MLNKKKSLWLASLILCSLVVFGGIYYTDSNAATPEQKMPNNTEPSQKPIDPNAKSQTYINNPEPIYKSNKGNQEQLLSAKDEILQKIRLGKNQKVISSDLITWGEYNRVDGGNVKNYEVEDGRLVWKVTIDAPDGINTKGGNFLKATVIYAIDAETGKVFETNVTGERDWSTVNPAIRNIGK